MLGSIRFSAPIRVCKTPQFSAILCNSPQTLFFDLQLFMFVGNLTVMATKYVQKVIPSVKTDGIRNLPFSQLKKVARAQYEKYCLAKKVVTNLHIGIRIELKVSGGKKTINGEALYGKKVAIIKALPALLEHAQYNNFGSPKKGDPQGLIGYYNFKAYVIIDKKKECVRLAVRAFKNGTFYYSVEVNKKK